MRINNSQFNKPHVGFQGAIKVRKKDSETARNAISDALRRARGSFTSALRPSHSLEQLGCKKHEADYNAGTTFEIERPDLERAAVKAVEQEKIDYRYRSGTLSPSQVDTFVREHFDKKPDEWTQPVIPKGCRTRAEKDREERKKIKELLRPDGTVIRLFR